MSETQSSEGGLHGAVGKLQDAVGGMVGMASAGTAGAHSSAAFVANVGMGDLYEIQAGALALQRARSAPVRAFAAMMVAHHTTSAHQLRSALHSSEVTRDDSSLAAPTALDNRREGMIAHLRDAADDGFDQHYLDQQKLSHQETLTLLKGYGEHGDNPQLASLARSAAPMVARHAKALAAMSG